MCLCAYNYGLLICVTVHIINYCYHNVCVCVVHAMYYYRLFAYRCNLGAIVTLDIKRQLILSYLILYCDNIGELDCSLDFRYYACDEAESNDR